MKVKLKHHTPLDVCSDAIRCCWDSHDNSDTKEVQETWMDDALSDKTTLPMPKIGPKDAELIDRVGNKFKHASTLEHLVYSFHIKGISRALLQELARHRIASLSVKSTRYTLKELKKEEPFFSNKAISGWLITKDIHGKKCWFDIDRAEKYVVLTGIELVDATIVNQLSMLKGLIDKGISNDKAKYALPEAYRTELTWTINARSLQNFLYLRSDKSALWEIQKLAHEVHSVLPEEHKYLFEEHIKNGES